MITIAEDNKIGANNLLNFFLAAIISGGAEATTPVIKEGIQPDTNVTAPANITACRSTFRRYNLFAEPNGADPNDVFFLYSSDKGDIYMEPYGGGRESSKILPHTTQRVTIDNSDINGAGGKTDVNEPNEVYANPVKARGGMYCIETNPGNTWGKIVKILENGKKEYLENIDSRCRGRFMDLSSSNLGNLVAHSEKDEWSIDGTIFKAEEGILGNGLRVVAHSGSLEDGLEVYYTLYDAGHGEAEIFRRKAKLDGNRHIVYDANGAIILGPQEQLTKKKGNYDNIRLVTDDKGNVTAIAYVSAGLQKDRKLHVLNPRNGKDVTISGGMVWDMAVIGKYAYITQVVGGEERAILYDFSESVPLSFLLQDLPGKEKVIIYDLSKYFKEIGIEEQKNPVVNDSNNPAAYHQTRWPNLRNLNMPSRLYTPNNRLGLVPQRYGHRG